MNERTEARKATILAYKNRVIGDMKIGGEAIGRSRVVYDGDFPYKDVAEAADIPFSPALDEHKRAWDTLYKLFDEEWSLNAPVS